MSNAAAHTVTTVSVKILDKEYQVACPPDQVEELTASAAHLHRQMLEIRDTGKVIGLDRIAVMAALNISHELLRVQKDSTASAGAVGNKVKSLIDRLDSTLAKHKQYSI